MNISFVLGHELPFPPEKGGGVNSLLYGLCKSLAASGHSVTAYSPAVANKPDLEILDGVKHVRVRGADRRVNRLYNFVAGAPYALKIKELLEDCDVLSCHLWQGFFFSGSHKAKIVTHTVHRDPKKFLYLFSKVDRIYTGSDAVTNDAVQVVPSLSKKIKTIYNCVDFTGFSKPFPRTKDGSIRFLYVGRFTRDKGLESFIQAFCEAAVQNPAIRFKTIGPITNALGADEVFAQEMRDYVNAKGFADRVEFAEPVFNREKLNETINAADVIVLPSTGGETLNMSVLECMRLGKALLISDLPANKPLNIEGKTGYFAKAGDVADWKAKLLDLASSGDRLEDFGQYAYAYAKEKFSCEQIAVEYVRDFENLLENNRNR